MRILLALPILLIGLLSACKQPADAMDTDSKIVEKQTTITAEAEKVEPTKIDTATKQQYNANTINFDGFGPAKFGDNEESVRIAWGRPLNADTPSKGATCYYLNIAPNTNYKGIAFMMENAIFVRYDVKDNSQVAPGNIVVGDTAQSIMKAHAENVILQPHKYTKDARTMTVLSTQQPNSKLIFDVNAENIVTNWRIGVTPQIDYVEGCS